MNRLLIILMLLLVACGGGNKFVPPTPPDAGAEDHGPTCEEHTMGFSDYIVGVPAVVRVRRTWAWNWCVLLVEDDLLGFQGSWYFLQWETTFSNWEQIEHIVLMVDGRPLAWVVDDVTGHDSTYDVGPYIWTEPSRREGYATRLCLPVQVDLDVWTATERLDFSYRVESLVCPE